MSYYFSMNYMKRLPALAMALLALIGCDAGPTADIKQTNKPIAARDPNMKTEKATFGAGCFWGVEATFRQMPGVVSTAVGYSGGRTERPTYEEVCSDDTGHAEVVEVEYDPAQVKYEQLLDVFWKNHNPTQLNRQGPDVGRQYRSAIFYHSPEQQAAAEASKAVMAQSGKWRGKPVVTEITEAAPFWKAEDYHQQYLEKRGLSSCHSGIQ